MKQTLQTVDAQAASGGVDDVKGAVGALSLPSRRGSMARFQMDTWLTDYGFRRVTGEGDWWAWPDGLPYIALDLKREGENCVIEEYRDQYPPRTAVGDVKAEVWDPEEPPARWTEYRFRWPKTRLQAEAMADAMGWRDDPPEPKETPLDEWVAGGDAPLKPGQE
jgi:hypothetical protein